jgi:hypothetical protein
MAPPELPEFSGGDGLALDVDPVRLVVATRGVIIARAAEVVGPRNGLEVVLAGRLELFFSDFFLLMALSGVGLRRGEGRAFLLLALAPRLPLPAVVLCPASGTGKTRGDMLELP